MTDGDEVTQIGCEAVTRIGDSRHQERRQALVRLARLQRHTQLFGISRPVFPENVRCESKQLNKRQHG